MTADALTKVVRLAAQAAPGILERLRAKAIVIDRRGMRQCGLAVPVEATAADVRCESGGAASDTGPAADARPSRYAIASKHRRHSH